MNIQKTVLQHARIALLISFMTSSAMAEITVDETQGKIDAVSDTNGTISIKIVGPDDVVVVDESYEGNSFSWTPSIGLDGAYRYDIRVVQSSNIESTEAQNEQNNATEGDYAGGSVEVINGKVINSKERGQ